MGQKKLIIVAHPNIRQSAINKRWVEEVSKYPQDYTVHNIYDAYPDWKIDVEKEQHLLEQYDTIVFQYPMFWFNCPPLVKKYLDDVFAYGWAFGSKGIKLRGKKFAIAVSTGNSASDYQVDGRCHITVGSLLQPFKTTAEFCGMTYEGFHTLNGRPHVTPEILEEDAKAYLSFLRSL
ncbi:MAG: NAD(P)H-dependent oxidoreductase [Prevotella sp.]|jgi:putative NADPH-quinone reductase|uniref:NAD(P)H-dependent oxidoreductase n=1 Tax=Segatella cerevisiae TaxID=2053716 RepID=A0ABT1BV47_9BACT|nr:NAD(P)H-dependent oxidoreductase [Segatella cerevisiae]MCH3993724.1 NAD(P)H-dependent oxidoreductase [Prevotella sp.]MCI1247091.1 NAD(P)H-dependent oxidoreductase [Prevotella sp.]MCO6024575.1 NAD(P)H-dependent oxidoreductase [Segatella cerevisiae]